MSASKILSHRFTNVVSLNLKGACYGPSTSIHLTRIHQNIYSPLYMCKRHFFINIENINVKLQNIIKLVYPSTRNIQKSEKEVYLLTDHFKNHKKVERVSLVKSLSSTILSIKGKETKVVYIVGLPGTGKKELARQYAEQQYRKLKKRGNSNVFVAAVDVSDPTSFHQYLFKIAEKMGIFETFNEYERNAAKRGGYKDILLKLSNRLKDRSGWILVLNDLKLNKELQWRVGERHTSTDKINRTIDLDLSDVFLPSPGELSDGTIIITTCDSFAKSHHANNVKYLDMPKGMEDQEALKLLQFASGKKDLLHCESPRNIIHKVLKYMRFTKSGQEDLCESARKVIQDLHSVPTSIYW